MFQSIKTMLLGLFVVSVFYRASALDYFPVTDADKKFLSEVTLAVNKKDTAWIASHMVYPLSIVSSNQTRLVKTKEEFASILRQSLTDSVRAKIADDAKKTLFKNWRGVMVGDGILWFSDYLSSDQASSNYGIFAIGHFASQPITQK